MRRQTPYQKSHREALRKILGREDYKDYGINTGTLSLKWDYPSQESVDQALEYCQAHGLDGKVYESKRSEFRLKLITYTLPKFRVLLPKVDPHKAQEVGLNPNTPEEIVGDLREEMGLAR